VHAIHRVSGYCLSLGSTSASQSKPCRIGEKYRTSREHADIRSMPWEMRVFKGRG
jgi:hypothetical protein